MKKKNDILQHINLSGNEVQVLSIFNVRPLSLTIAQSGYLYIKIKSESTVKMIHEKTEKIIDTSLTVKPWILSCVHVTKDYKIVLGSDEEDKVVQ